MSPVTSREKIWFRIGYALETARLGVPALPGPGAGESDPTNDGLPTDAAGDVALGTLLVAGAGAVAPRVLRLWRGRRVPGALSLAFAGLSGAGAALLLELLRPLTRGELEAPEIDADLGEAVLSGVGRGLLYGAVLEPRLPGPPVVRGAVFGAVEYALSPWGGLSRILGSASPHRKLPVVSDLLEPGGHEDDRFADHLVFGLAVALLYGGLPLKSGTRNEE